MDELREKAYELRAKLPKYVRYAAVGVLGLIVLIVVVGFYRERQNGSFHLRPEDAKLSTDVVAEVNDYHRLETDGDIKKYYITADHARTFSDDHQELENVYIEVYDANGDANKIRGDNALYIPQQD